MIMIIHFKVLGSIDNPKYDATPTFVLRCQTGIITDLNGMGYPISFLMVHGYNRVKCCCFFFHVYLCLCVIASDSDRNWSVEIRIRQWAKEKCFVSMEKIVDSLRPTTTRKVSSTSILSVAASQQSFHFWLELQ